VLCRAEIWAIAQNVATRKIEYTRIHLTTR